MLRLEGPEMRHDSARPGSLTHSLGSAADSGAVPAQQDGMRALPVTEADDNADVEVVEDEVMDVTLCKSCLSDGIFGVLTLRSFRSFLAAPTGPLDSVSFRPIADEVVLEILGANEPDVDPSELSKDS